MLVLVFMLMLLLYSVAFLTKVIFSTLFLAEFTEVKIINPPPDNILEVGLGDPVNKTCKGSGNPRPSVQWWKIAEGKSEVLQKADTELSQATLYIDAVTKTHIGQYTCVANSSLDTSEVSLSLGEALQRMGFPQCFACS